jgi:hypothetical protein
MVTATPETLGQVLGQVLQSAADAAAAAPDALSQVFDQAGQTVGRTVDEAEQLPADALTALEHLIDPPDWASLLIFLLLKVRDLDPDHLSVGSLQPDGWSRAVTLTYTVGPGKSVTIGFAMTDPAPARHGILLQATAGLAIAPTPLGPLTFAVSSQGDASWRLAFSGGVQPPAEQASINAQLSWDPGIRAGNDTAGISVGALRLAAALSTLPGAPLYSLRLGFGDAARPGLEAKVDLGQLLGALGAIVHVAALDESYSPELVLTQGTGPQFSLGEKSSA